MKTPVPRLGIPADIHHRYPLSKTCACRPEVPGDAATISSVTAGDADSQGCAVEVTRIFWRAAGSRPFVHRSGSTHPLFGEPGPPWVLLTRRKAPSRLWGRGEIMQPTPRGSGVWVAAQKG